MVILNINITDEESNYMREFIHSVIEKCGPRMPCSPQEAQGAEIIKEELKNVCDDVNIEPFLCNPRAFLGFIKVDIALVFLSFLLFFLIPLNLFNYWGYLISILSFSLNIISFLIYGMNFLIIENLLTQFLNLELPKMLLVKFIQQKKPRKFSFFLVITTAHWNLIF